MQKRPRQAQAQPGKADAYTHFQWRLIASYAAFQLLNLISLVLAMLVSACLLAFVLALRGQTITHLLPWFLIIAVPMWVAASYWTYSLLIRHGVLRERPDGRLVAPPKTPPGTATRPRPANDDNEDESYLMAKLAPVRRLFSL